MGLFKEDSLDRIRQTITKDYRVSHAINKKYVVFRINTEDLIKSIEVETVKIGNSVVRIYERINNIDYFSAHYSIVILIIASRT